MTSAEFMVLLESRWAEWPAAQGPTAKPTLAHANTRLASRWNAELEVLDDQRRTLAESIVTDRAAAGGHRERQV